VRPAALPGAGGDGIAVGAGGNTSTATAGVAVGGVGETGTLDGAGAMSGAKHPTAGAVSGANHPPTITVIADGQGGH